MKIATYIIGALFVLVVAAVVVLPSMIDLNDYKGVIAARVKMATGRDLAISGDIDVSVLPAPTIAVTDMHLANIDGAATPGMVSIAAAEARIAFLPLLRGEVQVESIRFVDPVVELERLADGRVNWDFGTAADSATGAGAAVRLDSVVIENGTVVYRDSGSGIEERFVGLNITGGADTLAGPLRAEGRMVARGVPLTFKLTAGALDRSATPVSIELELPSAEASLSFSGSLRQGADGAGISGKLKVEGKSFSRAVAALDPADAPGAPAASFLDREFSATAAVTGSTTAARLDNLALELNGVRGNGTIDAAFAGTPRYDIALTLSRVDLDELLSAEGAPQSDDAAAAPAASGVPFALPAGIRADLDLKVNALVYNQAVVRQIALAMTLENEVVAVQQASALLPGGSDIAVFGAIDSVNGQPRFNGQVEVSVDNLRAVLDWLAVPVPAVPADRLRKLTFSSRLEVTPRLAKVSAMDLRIDLTRVSGGVNLGLGGRPAFNAIVNVDGLNLDAYLPPSEAALAPPAQDASAANPLAFLNTVNGELKARIGRLVYRTLPIDGLAIDAGLRNGRLELRSFEFDNASGARGVVSGTVSADGPAFDLRYGLKAEDIGPLLRLADVAATLPTSEIGRFTVHGSVGGSLSDIEFDAALATADIEATLAGTMSDLGSQPTTDVAIDVRGKDVARVARQFGFALPLAPQPGDSPFALKGQVGGDAARAEINLGVAALGIDARVDGIVTGLDGTLAYDVAVRARHPELVMLARLFAGDGPAVGNIGETSVSARVVGDATQARLSGIDAAIGTNRLGGEASVRWDGERPFVEAELTAGDFVADMFLASASGGASASTPGERWSRDPLDLSGLRVLDARARLKARSLTFGAFQIDDALLRLTIADGVLDIEELSGQFYGAPAEILGQIADAEVPTAEIEILLSGADMSRLLSDAADIEIVSGRGTLAGGFHTRGRSAFDMVSALAGEATIDLREGVIRGIDLSRLGGRLGSLESENDFLNLIEAALSGGETRIEALDGSFKVSDGVARTDDLRAVLDGAEGRAAGSVDLPRWLIDLASEFRLTEFPDAPSFGVDLKGPIDNPAREIQDEELRGYVVAKLVGDALKKAVPAVGDDTAAGIGGILQKLTPEPDDVSDTDEAPGGAVTKIEPTPEPEPQPEPEPSDGVVTKVEPQPEPEPAPEPTAEIVTKAEPDGEPEADAGAVTETVTESEASTGSAIGSLLDTLTGGARTQTETEPEETTATTEPSPEPSQPFSTLLEGILGGGD